MINLWMEGYGVQGGWGKATLLGTYDVETMDEAVALYDAQHADSTSRPERYTRASFTTDEAFEKRRADWKIWGCALFDNESDARKSFG